MTDRHRYKKNTLDTLAFSEEQFGDGATSLNANLTVSVHKTFALNLQRKYCACLHFSISLQLRIETRELIRTFFCLFSIENYSRTKQSATHRIDFAYCEMERSGGISAFRKVAFTYEQMNHFEKVKCGII